MEKNKIILNLLEIFFSNQKNREVAVEKLCYWEKKLCSDLKENKIYNTVFDSNIFPFKDVRSLEFFNCTFIDSIFESNLDDVLFFKL